MLWIAIVILGLQNIVQFTEGVNCARNPCGLVTGLFDPSTGYCCYDLAPTFVDALCTCPNNIPSVVNAPCRTTALTTTTTTTLSPQIACNRVCANGGVCNIVNGRPVCWCSLGYTGSNCEIQGMATRCYNGLCQAGTCTNQQVGSSSYAYCLCNPGYRGTTCNQCYFSCPSAGLFADTAQCIIGRYFYCQQAGSVPVVAQCPDGQRFNRFLNVCDSRYQCT